MRRSAAARRYARALFQLSRDEDRVEAVRDELDGFAALLEKRPVLREALFRPLYPVAERRAALDAVADRLGSSTSLRHFFSMLVDHRRLVDFDAIHSEFSRLADDAAGRTRAEVVSATALGRSQRDRLRRALEARTGRAVKLDVRVDPDLIGGAVATVGTTVFDGSLRTQLTRLRASLTKEW